MKLKLNKYILAGVIALASLGVVSAAPLTLSTNLPNGINTGTTNNILSSSAYVTGITVTAGANTGGTNVTLLFYDAATATNQISIGGYTNVTTFKTNITSGTFTNASGAVGNVVFTNSVGMVQTNKVTGVFTRTNVVAAASTTLPVIYGVSIPINGSSVNNSLQLVLTRGLSVVQNNGISNVTVTVTYDDIAP